MSRITYWMIQANDVTFIDTPERSECWIVKGGHPHALMLSCPLGKRQEMERVVAEIKAAPQHPTTLAHGPQLTKGE